RLLDADPLPRGRRARQLPRISDLARNRPARPSVAAARLGAADLVAARADLGDAGAARVGAGRLAAAGDRLVPRYERGLRGARRGVPRSLRTPRARESVVRADVNWLRVFFVGGLTSYRALFRWLNPWVYVPLMLGYPLFQIVFFAYLGRGVRLGSDRFFLIGNAVAVTAVACLFGMGQVIGNERWFQTLPALLSSPASRLALFLGRSLPTMLNSIFVAAFSLTVGALVLRVHIGAGAVGGLALAILAASFSCTGLGLCFGALGLRGRNVLIFANLVVGVMLVICGVNVPLSE